MLLASEGRPIPKSAVDYAAKLATQDPKHKASVHVLSFARIYGTSLGIPMPGLLPNKREWSDQREIVAKAVKALKGRGLKAEGHVIGTRNPTKHVLKIAQHHYCDVIVMAADPEKHSLIGDFSWAQEPYRVQKKATIPVYLVVQRPSQKKGRA